MRFLQFRNKIAEERVETERKLEEAQRFESEAQKYVEDKAKVCFLFNHSLFIEKGRESPELFS